MEIKGYEFKWYKDEQNRLILQGCEVFVWLRQSAEDEI